MDFLASWIWDRLRPVVEGTVNGKQVRLHQDKKEAGNGLSQAAGLGRTPAALVGMAAVAGLRLAAILWELRLPVFHVSDENGGTL